MSKKPRFEFKFYNQHREEIDSFQNTLIDERCLEFWLKQASKILQSVPYEDKQELLHKLKQMHYIEIN